MMPGEPGHPRGPGRGGWPLSPMLGYRMAAHPPEHRSAAGGPQAMDQSALTCVGAHPSHRPAAQHRLCIDLPDGRHYGFEVRPDIADLGIEQGGCRHIFQMFCTGGLATGHLDFDTPTDDTKLGTGHRTRFLEFALGIPGIFLGTNGSRSALSQTRSSLKGA